MHVLNQTLQGRGINVVLTTFFIRRQIVAPRRRDYDVALPNRENRESRYRELLPIDKLGFLSHNRNNSLKTIKG